MILCCGDRPEHCRVVSSNPPASPVICSLLQASSTAPNRHSCDNQTCPQALLKGRAGLPTAETRSLPIGLLLLLRVAEQLSHGGEPHTSVAAKASYICWTPGKTCSEAGPSPRCPPLLLTLLLSSTGLLVLEAKTLFPEQSRSPGFPTGPPLPSALTLHCLPSPHLCVVSL
uniref:Uncharacterized protein n=1 Tax=Rousettus aegyptiacus TaxID=9407 RepID=A0A7J8C2A6_ROUAE|nr:hypothetical protein HJG63_009311 [Rousettus aegyptiacus]